MELTLLIRCGQRKYWIKLGVTESYKSKLLKRQVVLSASEAAEMIIRYDTIHLYIFLD